MLKPKTIGTLHTDQARKTYGEENVLLDNLAGGLSPFTAVPSLSDEEGKPENCSTELRVLLREVFVYRAGAQENWGQARYLRQGQVDT